jgi:hypothetical protein
MRFGPLSLSLPGVGSKRRHVRNGVRSGHLGVDDQRRFPPKAAPSQWQEELLT